MIQSADDIVFAAPGEATIRDIDADLVRITARSKARSGQMLAIPSSSTSAITTAEHGAGLRKDIPATSERLSRRASRTVFVHVWGEP